MRNPEYTLAAFQDLAEIVEYARRDKPQAALNLLEKIEAKCRLLANSPQIGALQQHLGENVRAAFVGRYVVYYRAKDEGIIVLRVIAGERDVRSL